MQADPETRLQRMLDRLKAKGLRITPQRFAMLELLSVSDNHPTAEEIYEKIKERFPTTSLATVYKTIAILKEVKEVLELGFPDGSNRYDGSKPYPHPHVICVKCKKISDPELASFHGLKDELQDKTGYRILHHRLDFFGLCQECLQGE